MSDFFTWMRKPALDSRDAPKNESLAEHLKHCKAKKECPFEKKAAANAEEEDRVAGHSDAGQTAPYKKSEHSYRLDAFGKESPANADFLKKLSDYDEAHRIYAVSDVHSTNLDDLDIDGHGIVMIGGDFIERASEVKNGRSNPEVPQSPQEKRKEAEEWINGTFIPWIKKHPKQQFVIIPGNHDKYFQYHPDVIDWPENAHFLIDREINVNGLRIYGTPWFYYNMNGAFEVGHDELRDRFSRIPEGLDVLIAHTPPRFDGSDIDYGAQHFGHFGSKELTQAILEKKPKLVLCGHIHTGDHKPQKLGDSTVVNVSKIGTTRNQGAYAGRAIGFRKDGEKTAEFLLDENDGQQIHKSAYPVEGEKIKKNLHFRPDGSISRTDSYLILRNLAKEINAHCDVVEQYGDKYRTKAMPQENTVAEFKFTKKYIYALPDGEPYCESLKKWSRDLENCISSGYDKRAPHVEPPPGYQGTVGNSSKGWIQPTLPWFKKPVKKAKEPQKPSPKKGVFEPEVESMLNDLFAGC